MKTDRRRFVAGVGASLSVLAMPRGTKAYTAGGNASAMPGEGTILVGADYYPDQTPEELWADDARMMAEMGLTVVRMAEFAWGLMEPVEGQYHFEWLRRSVDMLHKAGIQTILGTPSAAPPPWLTTKYPEVFEKNANGTMLGPEGRRFTCPTNKRYRDLSLKVATATAKNFANTPGVVGWQIDNELTLGDSQRCYCTYCQAGFQDWLRAKYQSLEKLNAAWGTVFWSQTYSDFNQIPVPLPSGGAPNPGMALDYDRYQSAANVGFLDVQLRMLRTECPKHFVTTNNVAAVDAIDGWDLYRQLDFASTDNYPGFIAVYAAQGGAAISIPLDQLASVVSWGLDMTRSAKDGKPFFVMEQQSGKAGQNF
ncbi:MAG: beta-galactosidase, partial [Rhodospirillales bacterium]|nr:beta-galactosidase [Acetobacter sp.]